MVILTFTRMMYIYELQGIRITKLISINIS